MIHITGEYPVNFCKSNGDYKELYSPNDSALITRIQYSTSTDIDFLLTKLPESESQIKALKAFERSEILKKTSQIIKDNTNDLAVVISTEGGKPYKDALIEVQRAALTLELCSEETLRLGGEKIPMQRSAAGLKHLAFTSREPIGAVLAISAFNHPLNLIAHQAGCAIAAGNAVIIKPAPSTPISAYILKDLFEKAGLPKGIIEVVNAEVSLIEKLASSPQFKFISFIGSSKVGWNLRKIIAPGTRLSLEHGGVAPSLIRKDANLNLASQALTKGAFYHAGQVCISTQRIFVHKDVFEVFLSKFLTETKLLKTGDARLETTDVGPLIRKEEVIRIQSWIKEAIGKGAKLELGNETFGHQQQYLTPTILSNVPREALLMNEEVFGPVVCVNSYQDEEEIIQYLEQSPYIFESSLFTEDLSSAMNLSERIPAMTLVINNHSAYRVDWMPFGGHGLSGLGMGGVKYSIEEMTRLKQVIIRY